jgi:hypothetical protein
MRIRDVLKVKEQYLPTGVRSVAADQTVRTAVPVEMPNRIGKNLWDHETFSRLETLTMG